MELIGPLGGCALLSLALMLPQGEKPATTPPTTPPKETTPAAPATPTAPAAKTPPAALVPTKDTIVDTNAQVNLPTERVTLFGEQFEAELCLTPETRALGMGTRSEFPKSTSTTASAGTGAGAAMIFVHPRPLMLSYWMRNCLIGLDIIFVDGNGRITAIHEAPAEKLRVQSETNEHYEARLYRYSSKRPAQFAIELPLGSLTRLKPKLGQQVNFDWAKLAQRAR